MSFSLEGKTAIVTGGSRGIGKAIALELAKAGADVAITYARSSGPAEEVKSEIEALGRKALAIQSDAASTEGATQVVDTVAKEWGRVDTVVNNAGITRDNLLLRMNEEQWDDVIGTNLKSVFNYSKAVAKTMMRQRVGAIINIASVVGVSGNAGQSNYAASKAGIIGFSKSLAKELASRNIRVNVIAPGYILTDMTDSLGDKVLEGIKASTPLGRAGNAVEVAQAVVFLASDAASYITGEVLKVDGGMAM